MKRITIKEVTEKFDVDGNLIERVTRTETTEEEPVTVTPYWTDFTGGEATYTTTSTADAPTTKTRSGYGVK